MKIVMYIHSSDLVKYMRTERRLREVSQKEVAKAIGVSAARVPQWEKEQRPISMVSFILWCKYFKLPWQKTFKQYTKMSVAQAIEKSYKEN